MVNAPTLRASVPLPFCGEIEILPVERPPIASCRLLVVCSLPSAVRNEPPASPAESVAVGVLELTLITANLALVVVVPPSNRSSVAASFGEMVPLATFQLENPLPLLQVRTVLTVERVAQSGKSVNLILAVVSSVKFPVTLILRSLRLL